MRPVPGMIAVVVLLAFTVAGCGSSRDKPPDLIKEYLESTEIDNDVLPGEGTGTERVFDAFGIMVTAGPNQDVFEHEVFAAFACDAYYNEPPSPDCDFGAAAAAVDKAAGSTGKTYARSILVKHEDGSLEFITLFVVHGKGDPVLFDTTGQSYRGGLADFRENNTLLTADDWIRAPRDLTAVPADGDGAYSIEAVTVPGHTPGTWGWWLGAGGLAVVLLLGYVWLTWTPRARKRAPDNSDAGMRGSR